MKKQLLIFTFLSSILGNTWSQIAPGQWRDHLPYFEAISVTSSDDAVYCATDYAVFKYSLEDNSIDRFTKINSLSESGISRIKHNSYNDVLMVTYLNGNVDLIKQNKTINIPFIKESNIIGDKSINHIHFINDLAYLSTGFGIVVVDMTKDEIKDTYIIGPDGDKIRVNGLTDYKSYLYAITDNGIYQADINSQFLNDFKSWVKMSNLPGHIVNGKFSLVTIFNDSLTVNHSSSKDSIYVYDNNNWSVFPVASFSNTNKSFDVKDDRLVVSQGWIIMVYDINASFKKGMVDIAFSPGQINNSTEAIFTNKEDYIASADKNFGLVFTKSDDDNFNIVPNGPASTTAFDMTIANGELWVASGSVAGGAWNNIWSKGSVSSFSENEWTRYDYLSNDEFYSDSLIDVLSVAIDEETNTIYAGAMSSNGIIEMRDGKVLNRYNSSNSSIQIRNDAPSEIIQIADLAFDNDGNLWVSNGYTTNPLSVKTKDGNWKSFNIGSSIKNALTTRLIATQSGQKWILVPNRGIVVYDDNGTPLDDSDDTSKLLTKEVGNGGLPSNNVESIVEDLDGEIWVGTDQGVAVFFSPESVFSENNFDAQQILIEQDGNIQILLETETITSIEVDGANRKWIGTRSAGVFVTSEDGAEQVMVFNEDNSPLFSNNIIDIAIDPITGEAFFGTETGLISYRSNATIGDPNFTDVYAYPNPVREDYEGPITIKGLARDSDVKITDISGNVLFVTKSTGGQATWDGNSLNGTKVTSGVYLVFGTDEEGNNAEITKILVIR